MNKDNALMWLKNLLKTSDLPMEQYEDALDTAIKILAGIDCEKCSRTYGSLGCCDTVNNKWVYYCKEGQREYIFDKLEAEVEKINPVDFGSMFSYEAHGAASDFKDRVLEIIDDLRGE